MRVRIVVVGVCGVVCVDDARGACAVVYASDGMYGGVMVRP